MAARMAKGMDPLGDIPSDSDSDDSDSAGGADKVSGPAPAPKKEVDYDALRRAGYAGCVTSHVYMVVAGSARLRPIAVAFRLVRSMSLIVAPTRETSRRRSDAP